MLVSVRSAAPTPREVKFRSCCRRVLRQILRCVMSRCIRSGTRTLFFRVTGRLAPGRDSISAIARSHGEIVLARLRARRVRAHSSAANLPAVDRADRGRERDVRQFAHRLYPRRGRQRDANARAARAFGDGVGSGDAAADQAVEFHDDRARTARVRGARRRAQAEHSGAHAVCAQRWNDRDAVWPDGDDAARDAAVPDHAHAHRRIA